MAKSKFWRFIDGYDAHTSHAVGKSFIDLSYSGAVNQRMKRAATFRISSLARRVTELFAYTSTKSYGAGSLAFGILTLILHFAGNYFGAYAEAETTTLIIGIVFSVLSVPLLLVDRPLCVLLQDIPITDFILYEFFCIKRVSRREGVPSIHPLIAICLCALPPLLGYFVPLWTVVLAIAALVFVYVTLTSPEFSFIATLLVLPYLNYLPYTEIVFLALVLVTLVSFLRKVAYGKRVLHIEQYDLLIGLFVLSILVSGIFVKGVESFTGSLGMLVLSFGYVLTSNMVTNRRLADRVINAFVISSVPAGVIAVSEFVRAAFDGSGLSAISVGAGSSFGDPAVYAAFLVIVLPLTVALLGQSRGMLRVFYSLVLILNTGAVILTAERFAWLALLLGVFIYFAHKAPYASPLVVCMLAVFPYVLFLFPSEALSTVFSNTLNGLSVDELSELWQAATGVFSDNALLGIGIGEECFAEEFSGLGFAGVTNSHNLFLEIGLEAGIVALASLVLLIIVRFRHRSVYKSYVKDSQLSLISTMTAIAITCLIILGTTYYLFENMAILYLFWFVFGLGSAALRVAKREHDDKILYYEDIESPDSSVADIKIR